MGSSDKNFLQPILSILGLAISLLTALSPLFTQSPITDFFLNRKLAQPVSFITFIIGLAVVWQIIQFQPYPALNLGRLKDRGRGYLEFWKTVSASELVWILLLLSFVFGIGFLSLDILVVEKRDQGWSVLQAVLYGCTFLSLIGAFSILFAQARQIFIFQEQKQNFPIIVGETLNRHNVVKPWIEITDNIQIGSAELQQMGVFTQFIARRLKIRTSAQKQRELEVIVSDNGQELITVVKPK